MQRQADLGFVERHLAGDKNVHDDAEGPDVCFQRVVGATLQDLWCCVRLRTTERLTHVSAVCQLCNTYVHSA